MKLKQILSEVVSGPNIIFQNEYGYIQAKEKSNGIWWIDKLFVFPEYRGQGHARELAMHIPEKAMLLAQPMQDGTGLKKEDLINFYKSLGFEEYPDSHGNTIMKRNI